MASFQAFKLGTAAKQRPRPPSLFTEDPESEEGPKAQQGAQGPAADEQSAAQHKEAGDAAATAGQWGAALRSWDSALAAGAAEPHKLHESKAQVFLQLDRDWQALQCAQRAVALAPGWPEGHLTLGRSQLNMGEPELALVSLEQALHLCPGHPEAAEEVAAVRQLVLRRRASGDAAAGQRALVMQPGTEAAPEAEPRGVDIEDMQT